MSNNNKEFIELLQGDNLPEIIENSRGSVCLEMLGKVQLLLVTCELCPFQITVQSAIAASFVRLQVFKPLIKFTNRRTLRD